MAGREKDQKTGQKEKILVLISDKRVPAGFSRVLAVAVLGLACILNSCSGHVPYEILGEHLARGECGAAASLMADSAGDYGDNAELLFLLDSAMVHMRCRQFDAAQEKFRAAEDLAESLWTLSLSRETAAYLANDYVLDYAGEDFERAMIHMMSALAYLDAGESEEALVECRRLDSLLSLYNNRYAEKNVYKEDAFGRYLSGILREGDNNPDGAFLDYKKALETYGDYGTYYGLEAPADLKASLFRVAEKAGRLPDARKILPEENPIARDDISGKGRVVWILLQGAVPEKKEDRVVIPTSRGPLAIAFPSFSRPDAPGPRPMMELTPESGTPLRVDADLVSDIGAIAVKNLEDRRARIAAKAVARAVAKQVVISQAAGKGDKEVRQVVENALNILNLFLERADIRSWRSLPGRIYMASTFLAPGPWEVNATGHGPDALKKVVVKAGQIHYIIVNNALENGF